MKKIFYAMLFATFSCIQAAEQGTKQELIDEAIAAFKESGKRGTIFINASKDPQVTLSYVLTDAHGMTRPNSIASYKILHDKAGRYGPFRTLKVDLRDDKYNQSITKMFPVGSIVIGDLIVIPAKKGWFTDTLEKRILTLDTIKID